MNIDLIIKELRDRAAVFGGRVTGAAEFDAALSNSAGWTAPCAWVVPLQDVPERLSQTSTRMDLNESFGVYVMVASDADAQGQAAVMSVNDIRNAIWAVLLGWQLSEASSPIEYEGGELVHLDRARLFYRFEFSLTTSIGGEVSRQYVDLMALPDMTTLSLSMDIVDPAADANTPPVTDPEQGGYAGGYPGPDGRIEHTFTVDLPNN